MKEVVPVVFGIAVGLAISAIAQLRHWLVIPLAIVAAGVAASALNGELTNDFWPVFVSFDLVLVALGVLVGWRACRSYADFVVLTKLNQQRRRSSDADHAPHGLAPSGRFDY